MQTGTQYTGESTASPNAGSFPKSGDMAHRAEQTADRLADKAHETAERLSDRVQPTMDALSEKASHAVDRVAQRADQIRHTSETALESTRNYVRENPIAAIGIAAVAGLLLGRIRH